MSMTTTIAPTLAGGAYRPAVAPPDGFVEGWFDGSNFKFNGPADFFTAPDASPKGSVVSVRATPLSVPASFFGVHYNVQDRVPAAPPIKAKVMRIHDAVWNGQRCHWRGTQPSAGVFDWTALDNVVGRWADLGYDLIYTLCVTPAWASARPSESGAYGLGAAAEPSDMAYWDTFCQAVAQRYSSRVRYWEVWNEPNVASFFSGTKANLSAMTRRANQVIKAVDPSAVILSPPVTSLQTGGTGATYFDQLCTTSDGAAGVCQDWFDIVACHLYAFSSTQLGAVTEQMVQSMQAVMTARGISALPLWNTETGLLSPDAKTLGRDKMKHLKRAMLLAASLGVAFWALYTFDHTTMGIDDLPEYAAQWNEWRDMLMSGQITRINRLGDGRIAIVYNGQGILV